MGRAFEFRKARKMKRWDSMAKTFSRIGKEIAIAIRDGGPDPEANSKLMNAIKNAKDANMPLDIVNRAIKKATDKDMSAFKETLFEGYAPHGIAVLIETATDNNQRTVADIRSYFNKCNGSLGTSGSVSFMFDHQCHFKIAKGEVDAEELELELIDFGADEVFVDNENIMVYGSFENFGSLQAKLEEDGHEVLSSGFERIPHNTTALNPEQVVDVEKLLEKLDDNDDVLNVYHNMEG